jgi:DtxR family Mn-dependent transcriptional regulator
LAADSRSTAPRRALTETLEDYLEIILELSAEKGVVRVRDIARVKAVRMPSVISALKRLADLELVDYEAGEHARLTRRGAAHARGVAGRHIFLRRFLQEILSVPPAIAAADACGLEHHLSAETLERFSAFLEYVETCPEVGAGFLDRFRNQFRCQMGAGGGCRDPRCRPPARQARHARRALVPLAELAGESAGRIARLRAPEALRRSLMEQGLLPGVQITVRRAGGCSAPTEVAIRGQSIMLDPQSTAAIFVDPVAAGSEEPATAPRRRERR